MTLSPNLVWIAADMGAGDVIQLARLAPHDPDVDHLVLIVRPSLLRLLAPIGVPLISRDTFPLIGAHPKQWLLADEVREMLSELGVGGTFVQLTAWFKPGVDRDTDRVNTDWTPPPPASLWADLTIRWHAAACGPRIGLCWASSTAPNWRYCPADLLRPLFHHPATFVSLQGGPFADELRGLPSIAGVRDWADTAGLVRQCDLVITVDTGMAHLAGSLGVPTWLLLTTPTYHIWGDGDTTPWYPSLRIFRQPEPGAWAPVIARVAAELAILCAGRHR